MVIVQLFLLQMDILGLLLHLMDIVSYHIQLVWMIHCLLLLRLWAGKIGVCCYIKRAEESVRYTHSVVFILHWISINYGMPYIGFRFKIGACCYTCVKRYQTSIRNRSMLLQS